MKHEQRFALGLTQAEVDRLRDIIRQTRGVEMSNQEAWECGIRLLSLGLTILEASAPKTRASEGAVPLHRPYGGRTCPNHRPRRLRHLDQPQQQG
jgi:hypothetical protein